MTRIRKTISFKEEVYNKVEEERIKDNGSQLSTFINNLLSKYFGIKNLK